VSELWSSVLDVEIYNSKSHLLWYVVYVGLLSNVLWGPC